MEKTLENILIKAVKKKRIILSKIEATPLLELGFLKYHSRYGRKSTYHPTNAGIREYNEMNC